MFSTSFDYQPRDRKLSSYSSRSLRKRRANSDSELTLLESFERHSSYQDLRSPLFIPNPLHEYEDIDIMGNSNDGSNLLGGNSVIDPSQMFINNDSQDSSFHYSCDEIITDDINPKEFSSLNSDDDHGVSNDSSDSIPAMFSSSMFLVNQQTSDEINFPIECSEKEKPDTINTAKIGNSMKFNKTQNYQKEEMEKQRPKVLQELKPKLTGSEKLPVKNTMNVNQIWIYDKKELSAHGQKWRNGAWSTEEEKILIENIEKYCKKNQLADVKKLIFSTQKDERKQFYRTIAKQLNRPLFSIYRKVIRLYDNKNYVGQYSKKDENFVIDGFSQNHNWSQIGKEIGRSASSVKDKMRLIRNRNKKGHWDESELTALSEAVHEQTNTKKGDYVTRNINWVKISDKLTTRSEKQCRSKWLHYLNWKESGGIKWQKTDEIELINRVIQSSAREEGSVDWNKISQGWSCVRSPQWLRQKWWSIKRHYPKYQTCSFQELLYYLQTKYIEDNFVTTNDDNGQTTSTKPLKDDAKISSVPNDAINTISDTNRTYPSTNNPSIFNTGSTPLQILNIQILPNSLVNNFSLLKQYSVIQPQMSEYKYILPNTLRQQDSLPTNQMQVNDYNNISFNTAQQLPYAANLLTLTSKNTPSLSISLPTTPIENTKNLPTSVKDTSFIPNQFSYDHTMDSNKVVETAMSENFCSEPSHQQQSSNLRNVNENSLSNIVNDNSVLPKINTFSKNTSDILL